ncbi:hypothetical protein B0H15DRAFT_800670 [Mycena belliarum]|uniref:SAP domain-containing protein n=1 Tax=Mycena belliarum TaxID=1033014 RepID=A0AAD6XRA6_9AGAR|nr:hypothetical protein B0H15DRAFT_800670 [Mycena belliae]
MCRDYGLGVSGNKSTLSTRLQEFSVKFCNDPASCNITPVKRRSHKGPREGPKKTQPKQSANRRAAIIDTERVTERSKDTRTTDEMKDLLLWADRTRARLPYKPPKPDTAQPSIVPQTALNPRGDLSARSLDDRMQMIESHLATLAAASVATAPYQAFHPPTTSPVQPIPSPDYVIYDHAAQSPYNSYPIYNMESSNWEPTSEFQSSHVHHLDENITISASTFALSHVKLPKTSLSTSCVPNVPTRTITLGNGISLTLTVDEVKHISVPATSFAEDIGRLNQMWDDISPHWKNDSVLIISTHAIALMYWPEVFKKTGLWSAHKSAWTEWKGTPNAFWQRFTSKDGGKMSYTAICADLRMERKKADDDLAAQARAEYGEEFKVKFSYRCSKTNARVAMTKSSAIAKEYRRLHSA